MKKKSTIILAILLLIFTGYIFQKNMRPENKSIISDSEEQIAEFDSIKEVRSEEIKAALRRGSNKFSPLDYAFMIEEVKELNSEDTLYFAFSPQLDKFSGQTSDTFF